MINVVKAGSPEQKALFDEMRKRAETSADEISKSVGKIIAEVRDGGWDALCALSKRFDNAEPYEIPLSQCEAAMKRCDPLVLEAIKHAAKNIEDYQTNLLPKGGEWTNPDGGRVGVTVRGLTRVGVYVPGGTAAYPSSVLMNVIPAKVAGVSEIIMVTPPTEHLSDEVLAATFIAGVSRVFAIGGAQACAALAYGAGMIPRVDKIVGPGNAYVAEAKRMLYGIIDIDMIAGPSEVLVIADETANAAYVAADMLSQAEHDAKSSAILLTTSERLCRDVAHELETQLAKLPRRETAAASIDTFGAIVFCATAEEAVELANIIAPEHLEIMTAESRSLLSGIKNAGAVFLGEYTPEPVGDYMAGPCHVLPTSGTARFFPPLSVDDFVKKTSVIEYTKDALAKVQDEITAFARAEKLEAHARSIEMRSVEMRQL